MTEPSRGEAPTVVGVAGSRRRPSHTLDAVRIALEGAAAAGAETTLVDLGDPDRAFPLYHPDREEPPDVTAARERVVAAEGVVLGSPVYHGSYSSALKSFHDWCGRDDYRNTAVGLVAVAGGGTYATTLAHLRDTLRNVHGLVVPEQVGIRNASSRFADGALTDDGLAERTMDVGRAVADEAARRDGER